jgi:hypothetical protein
MLGANRRRSVNRCADFGTALRSDWATVGIQMIYSITYYLLLVNRTDNSFSLDMLFQRRNQGLEEPGIYFRASPPR